MIVYRRVLMILAALVALSAAPPAQAVFHFAVIDEVVTSYGGDPSVQFLEIRMLAPSQNLVANSVIAAFDTSGAYIGDVLVVPGNVANSGNGVPWIVGTNQFEVASGLTPDFTIPASLPVGGGMVCFGGGGGIAPAPPGSWDRTVFTNYVDCVAYGTYAGPSNLLIGTPTPLDADGHALQRVAETNDNANDFACSDPATPENNAGASASLAATTPCPVPPSADLLSTGKKILIKGNLPSAKRSILALAKEKPTDIGSSGQKGLDPLDDPVANGATLTVIVNGNGGTSSSQVFAIPAGAHSGPGTAGWKTLPVGFKYVDPKQVNGPVKVLLIKRTPANVFLMKVIIKGVDPPGALGVTVEPPNGGTPDATMSLQIGSGNRYCTGWGGAAEGTTKKNSLKTFLVIKPTAEVGCAG